tara:strand:- start:206 stop:484 length:279 start_codon:yes stop_codon:yes gene_type:complete
LGVIAYQVEEYQIATDLISRAVTIDSDGNTIEIILTAAASCPDVLLDAVIRKIILWFPDNLVFISDIMLPWLPWLGFSKDSWVKFSSLIKYQ